MNSKVPPTDITQPGTRKIEGFQIRQRRRPVSVLPEVLRRGEEGLSNNQAPQRVRLVSPRDNDPKYEVKAERITPSESTPTHPVKKFASKLPSMQVGSYWVL